MRKLLVSIMILALGTSAAHAASSGWQQTEGARLRIVTAGQPDAKGELKGTLQIELKPGWKTYWRDPGASGVPPSIDVSASTNIASLDMAFPAPMRFDDASGAWIGYKHSVAFPVTFRLAAPDQPARIDAQVFIGVCETICVPFQARLSLDPASNADDPDDAAIVEAAAAALPRAADADFGASLLSAEDSAMQVTASFPGSPDSADLFVAGLEGYTLGTPEKRLTGGKTIFTIPVLDRPTAKPEGKGLPYTLATEAGAVDGLLPYP